MPRSASSSLERLWKKDTKSPSFSPATQFSFSATPSSTISVDSEQGVCEIRMRRSSPAEAGSTYPECRAWAEVSRRLNSTGKPAELAPPARLVELAVESDRTLSY